MFIFAATVRNCNVSKNRFDLVSTSDKHSDTPHDTDGVVKINGRYAVHDFNFNTI